MRALAQSQRPGVEIAFGLLRAAGMFLPDAVRLGRPAGVTARELALLFVRLGFTAFGGPAAHVALMEHEVVTRRRWLSSERFLDLLGVANLIPGPSSTELAILIGYEQAGWLG